MIHRTHFIYVLSFALLISVSGYSQEQKGQFSGSIDANINFFMEDETIGATNTPQYDKDLFGVETWINLKYRIGSFDAGVRFDLFHDSNLLNPTDVYNDYGIGRIYVSKQ